MVSKIIHRSTLYDVIPRRKPFGQSVLSIRSLDSGILGQGIRFASVGVVVTLIYVTTTTVLTDIFGVPFQLALAFGLATAICVHFTLQRLFVWVHHAQFALGVRGQLSRYLPVAGIQYAITATSTLLLPGALDVSVTIVYLVITPTLTVVNFLFFRRRVFHAAD